MKYVVEKIENNIVVLESLDNKMKKEVLLSKLPAGTKEGTILTYENDAYTKDEALEQQVEMEDANEGEHYENE